MERTEKIYVLKGTHNGKPFYLGHTKREVDVRLDEHVEEARSGGKSLKCGHIRWLLANGHQVTIQVVDECPEDELDDLEAWWIGELHTRAVFLYNGNGGIEKVARKKRPQFTKPIVPIADHDAFNKRVAWLSKEYDRLLAEQLESGMPGEMAKSYVLSRLKALNDSRVGP